MKLKQLSVFFPAYNEAAVIAKTVTAANQVLKKIAEQYEIIVVNDGSTDNTANQVKALNLPRLQLASHPKNLCYGEAMKTGWKKSRYPWILSCDADGQFNFKEISQFIPFIKDYDLIIGYRRQRSDSRYRRFMAAVLRLVNIILFRLNLKDVDCGFKLISRKVIQTVWPLTTASAITVTELMVKALRQGFKVKEIGVKHHHRKGGEQTGGKLKVVVKGAWEGIKLWLALKQQRPENQQ